MKIGDRHKTGSLIVACLALIAHATTTPTQAQLDNYLNGIAHADLEQRSAERRANTTQAHVMRATISYRFSLVTGIETAFLYWPIISA